MSDAYDSDDDESDDQPLQRGAADESDNECDDFLAPEDAEVEPVMGAVFARTAEGRLMSPRVYALFEALLHAHTGDGAKVAADMIAAFPVLDAYAMHIALAQVGAPAAKVGDRVWVPYPDDRQFYKGVVTRVAPRYAFVEYADRDAVPMDGAQLVWHYIS